MSDDVKVTREHRERALDAMIGASRWPLIPLACHYAATGEDSFDDMTLLVAPKPVALAIAAAEHRARASIIADLRGLLERSEFIGPVDYVQADSIRNLIDTLEAQS